MVKFDLYSKCIQLNSVWSAFCSHWGPIHFELNSILIHIEDPFTLNWTLFLFTLRTHSLWIEQYSYAHWVSIHYELNNILSSPTLWEGEDVHFKNIVSLWYNFSLGAMSLTACLALTNIPIPGYEHIFNFLKGYITCNLYCVLKLELLFIIHWVILIIKSWTFVTCLVLY